MEDMRKAFQNEDEYRTALAAWAEALSDPGGNAEALWNELAASARSCAEAGLFLPLFYLQAAFDLTTCQTQALALALLAQQDGRDEALTLHRGVQLLTGAGDRRRVRSQLTCRGTGWELCLESLPERETDAICPDPRIQGFVLGGDFGVSGLRGLTLEEPDRAAGPGRLEALAGQLADFCRKVPGERVTFLLLGQPGSGRRTLARCLARQLDCPLLLADGQRLLEADAGAFRRALRRETVLQRCPVLFTDLEQVLAATAEDRELGRELTRLLAESAAASGLSLLAGEEDWQPEDGPADWRLLPVTLPQPGLGESAAIWEELLAQRPREQGLSGERLAAKYRLTPGQMKQAVSDGASFALWEGKGELTAEAMDRGCRRQLRHRLGDKARRVENVFTWDELILPETAKGLLRSACDQVRHRTQVYDSWGFGQKLSYGGGLSLLFSGPPGTGKTMAAQVAAGELGLELYKVELPAIVSKYVGETEKNLRDIFREAARSQAILFFDEADVLFAKRTEMKDAQDKYSNMEAAYLLQKMEEYPGISILATNFLQNFDEAFKRRLKFIIDFPFPDGAYRLRLWRSVFPPQTPVDRDVDWEFLAQQFELSGSAIKNTAVNAAFLAAGEGTEVNMGHLLIALRRELQKSGKSLSRQDFGPYYMLVEEESHGGI